MSMDNGLISGKVKTVFDRAVDIVFGVILLFIILGIAIGTFQLFFSVWELLKLEGITGHYIDLIADILTLYVLVELSRSLVDYYSSHSFRLTYIVDAAIVFIIREVLIALFKHEVAPDMLYAHAAILFVLGAIRMGSVLVSGQASANALETKID